ncbi:hypothetical protein [Cytobacillus sp.]|uniref:hypothetical protein n=1 Tax=Cytobacillus sp. TaxID=2675269 RepID=UPI0037BF96E8
MQLASPLKEQLTGIDGIIIPGGESTTIGKMMSKYGFNRGNSIACYVWKTYIWNLHSDTPNC